MSSTLSDTQFYALVAGVTLLLATAVAFVLQKTKTTKGSAGGASGPGMVKRETRRTKSPARVSPPPKNLSKRAQRELESLKFASPGKGMDTAHRYTFANDTSQTWQEG
jgi:hypothetical protein